MAAEYVLFAGWNKSLKLSNDSVELVAGLEIDGEGLLRTIEPSVRRLL